jgi:hypothetical protein
MILFIQVQEAACWLIDCLIKKDDLSNAGFSEQTYSNLRGIKNGVDQEGEIVARGAYNLADVIYQQEDGDVIKAEMLSRKSMCIREKLHGANNNRGVSCLLLAKILQKQGNFGDETKELFERSLAITIRKEGPDGLNTACVNFAIGQFYYRLAVYSKRKANTVATSQILFRGSNMN